MVRLVPGHHLVAGDAVGDRVHDRPLRRRDLPAALRFFVRQLDHLAAAEVRFQRAVLDEDAAPDDLAGLADAFQSFRRPAGKYIGGCRSLTAPA